MKSRQIAAMIAAAAVVGAPAGASAKPSAEVAKAKRAGHYKLLALGATPRTVSPSQRFRVTVRLRKQRRRAARPELRFSLRRTAASNGRDAIKLRNTRLRRPSGRHRTARVSLRIPASTPAGRYTFRACVHSRPLTRASCRGRAMMVARPGQGSQPQPQPQPQPEPESFAQRSLRAPVTGENFYFLMADRFENGTTANDRGGYPDDRLQSGYDPTHKGFYHGGDLQGILERMDYIQGLGTTAIWLTPSFENKPVQGPPGQETAGYHGYWITDFTRIDPHLGSNEDLARVVEAAHARGMKVFFDIITNHTADVITYEAKNGGPQPYGYVSKDEVPYRTAAGEPFDDRDFAGGPSFPALDPQTSFPFVPRNPPGAENPSDVNHKTPEWLNDVRRYHNRGDTTFTGENSQYGDFFGLDDLFTEQPEVVDGMIDIYKAWIRDFGIDGFRIDTMKHVDDAFWQRFAPEVLDYARSRGKREFFMFGEVYDTTKRYTSHFTTRDRVQAVIDFPFQAAARAFAADSTPTDELREFFAGDDHYTDADSNAYQLPTFLGNHDMGRIGLFIRQANAGASDDEVFRRDRLAHELMYLVRGNPVVYYGDEQGFVGDGGDQDARQDMFESQVASYNDDDNIATGESPAQDNFDADHPLYRAIGSLADLTRRHPALRSGLQQTRHSTAGAGIFAFSRYDRGSGHEYVVALNNSEQPQSTYVQTAAAGRGGFERLYGEGPDRAVADAARRLRVDVPALSAVVWRSSQPVPPSRSAPEITLVALPDGEPARDRAPVQAFVDGGGFYDVTFQARVGDGEWQTIGTDDNAPYRVFDDIAALAPGTRVSYRAAVLDNAGNVRTSDTESIEVAEPAIELTSPPENGRIRNEVPLAAQATPDHNHYSVTFQRKIGDGDWTDVATDSSQPAYSASDDVSSLTPGTQVRYRAVLTYAAGRAVTSGEHSTTVSTPVTTATIHYHRPAGDYESWGLHLWGDGLAPGQATGSWDTPTPFEGRDAYGAFHQIQIVDDTKPIGFIVHGMPPNQDSKDTGSDRYFTPLDNPEIWIKQGDPTIYFTQPPG